MLEKVIIPLSSISNIEQESCMTGLKGLKRLWENRIPITFFNLFNLVACDSRKIFTKELGRIITFLSIVSNET